PTDPPPFAHHVRRGERLISEVRMTSLDHARDAVDLVATAINALGLVEYGVFVEDLVDRCASTHGINLSEHVMEVAKQQGRYGVRHFSLQRCDVARDVNGHRTRATISSSAVLRCQQCSETGVWIVEFAHGDPRGAPPWPPI